MHVKTIRVSDNVLLIPFTRYAIVTVCMPAFALALCFVTAFLYRSDEVTDTDCKVINSIPSVSAVTGIKPQAYFWRMCIGLHSTPRFFVGFMYYNYYKNSLPHIKPNIYGRYKFLMNLCFWLYNIECFCLLAVSCVSNKENYPIHERIFVVFMTASIAHMVFETILFRWSRYQPMTAREKQSYFWKRTMLLWISLSTVGLLLAFVQHRFYCVPGAFSVFSVFEYMIAYSNIGYHATGYFEFEDKCLLAGIVLPDKLTNGAASNNTKAESLTNGIASNNTKAESLTNGIASNNNSSQPISNGDKKDQ